MRVVFAWTFLLVLCNIAVSHGDATISRLKISVYYEILCPDSIKFITQQLFPVYKEIPGYLILDLVPYGIATTTLLPNSTYIFKCQHGPKECHGNKVHSCAINLLKSRVSPAFINCTMSQMEPSTAGEYCSKLLNIPWNPLEKCVTSGNGSFLLAKNGNRTNSLNPALYWVPWITFDDVFYHEDLDPSQVHLLPVVCKHLKGTKPHQCNELPDLDTFSISSGLAISSTSDVFLLIGGFLFIIFLKTM